MRMALFLVVLVGGAGGLLLAEAPSSTPTSPAAAPTVEPTPAIATLERDPGGHFIGFAEVNGHTIRVVVDTGAFTVALTPEDARLAGLAIDPSRWSTVGRSATGEARGERLTLASLSIGGVKRMDVSAAVIDGLPVSLLGQSFLRRLDTVEIHGDRMTLR